MRARPSSTMHSKMLDGGIGVRQENALSPLRIFTRASADTRRRTSVGNRAASTNASANSDQVHDVVYVVDDNIEAVKYVSIEKIASRTPPTATARRRDNSDMYKKRHHDAVSGHKIDNAGAMQWNHVEITAATPLPRSAKYRSRIAGSSGPMRRRVIRADLFSSAGCWKREPGCRSETALFRANFR